MAALHPYCRLIDLQTDLVLAGTDNLVDWEVVFDLDKVGSLTIEVGAGDAGDASGGPAFAAALLQAASDLGATPKPLLLEFSLDGGASYDSRKIVEQPVRTLKASQRTVREDGADLGSILATVPCERVTYTDCKLVDVFNAPDNGIAGSITPIAATGITGGAIPYLQGLLTVEAGLPGWAGRARVQWTAQVDPLIQATATNVDVDSATTLAACETVVNRLAGAFIDGDSVPQGYRGHYVADPSDAGLNLGGGERSFVVGNVAASATTGSTDSVHLTFDATGAHDTEEPYPEATVARLHLDSATLKSDDTTLTPAANFVGGKSTAGFPDGAKITGLTILNGTSATMSGTKADWRDGVPLIGINVNDASGGLFFTILDGLIRPVPGSPAAPCQSIAADLGTPGSSTRPSALFMGTNHGIYFAESVDLNTGGAAWSLLGDLNANVVRMQVEIDSTDTAHRVVFALVKGSGERTDGIYRWTHNTGDSNRNAGTWATVLQNTNVVDMIATDYQQFWCVLSKPQNVLGRYAVTSGRGDLEQQYTLPGAGQIERIQEVVTVAHGAVPAQDTVWALCAGAPSPAYYLVNSGDNFAGATFYDANQDGSLVGPGGTALQLNRVVGLGISFDGTIAQAFAGTDQGVYYTTAGLGSVSGGVLAWKSANQQGGLANYNIKSIAAPESQYILGRSTNRIFCTTEDDLLYSNSSGRWWDTIKGKDRTTAGPCLSAMTLNVNDANGTGTGQTLPYSRVRTWGSANADGSVMDSSPLAAAANTHVTIPATIVSEHHDVPNPDRVPSGYYWERYLDQHLDFQYRLVNQTCPFPGLQMAQLPELQSNAAVDALTASRGVMTVARRWLPQHAVPQTMLELTSSFTETLAGLRDLRPTHLVRVQGQVIIADISSAGDVVSTRVMDFAGTEDLWVLSHKIAKGPGLSALTSTTVGTQLCEKLPSESDLAAGLADSLAATKIWR